ncbi:hypothetical protein FRB99_008750 [Tulasnella sp. 403]|nr:hypothetical protein FRB99_008750 [Tulasnella sp. 403]
MLPRRLASPSLFNGLSRSRLSPNPILKSTSISFQLRNTSATPPTKAAKPKPNKSTTALKRVASASLPIRQSPTRGTIRPVFTFSTAERYDLSQVRRLPSGAVKFEQALWIPSWTYKGDTCELWIFDNGSVVCWGAGEDTARAFLRNIFEKNPAVQVGLLDHAETEELEFVTDPNEATRLQGDLIILGRPAELSELEMPELSKPDAASLPPDTAAARYAFSHALARSTSLSGLESSLDQYLSSVSMLPITLSETGRPGLERKEIIMKLGQLLRLRQSLNLTQQSFSDTPDFYWTEPALEEYFKMELIIIALIAVEVFIAFVRDGPELWDAVFGSDNNTKKHKH